MFEMLDVGVLVRFSQMFPDVLYTCSNIPAIPASADRSEGIVEVWESFLKILGRRERTKEEKCKSRHEPVGVRGG